MTMRIDIVAVGKLSEPYWREAADEYTKRLKPYAKLKVHEIDDRASASLSDAEVLAKEAADIEKAVTRIKDPGRVILLDIEGMQLSSEGLAERIDDQAQSGNPQMTFIIGGSLGVDKGVHKLISKRISFGPLTLPHNLARIVLLEQLYRSFKIIRGEPYHK